MKICLASSAGGHFTQVEAIADGLRQHDPFLVTVPSPHTTEELDGFRKYFVRQILRNPATLVANLIQSLGVFLRERPDAIITTGAGDALPILMIGAALGAKTVFVESFSRVQRGSLSGRIAWRWCDLVVLQWPELRASYPKGEVAAPLFAVSTIRGHIPSSPSILVLTGTHVQGFERLLQTLDRLVENGRLAGDIEAQIGNSAYTPKHFRYFRFLPHRELLGRLRAVDIVISHDGAGSIGEALSLGKPTIIVPRNRSFNEVAYDSDQQLAKHLADRQSVILVQNPEELPRALERLGDISARGTEWTGPSVVETVRRFLELPKAAAPLQVWDRTRQHPPGEMQSPRSGPSARIAIVTPISPWDSRPSGIRTYIGALVSKLPGTGVRLNVTTPGPVPKELPPGVSAVVVADSPISSLRFLIRLALNGPRTCPEADIVHFQRLDNILPLLPWCYSKNKVITLHGEAEKSVLLRKGRAAGLFFSFMEALASVFVDRVIAVNDETMRSYAKKLPWLEGKLEMIPIGAWLEDGYSEEDVLPADGGIPEGAPVVLYAGRLSAEKNLSLLLDSFASLRRQLPSAFLIIVGEGPEETTLKRRMMSGELSGCVLLPSMPRGELFHLLRRADVVAIPSMFESGPLVAIEAICLGTPVVSTPVGRIPDVLSRHLVGAISSPDPDSFSSALEQVLRAGKAQFTGECLLAAQSLSIDSTLVATTRVYGRLLGGAA